MTTGTLISPSGMDLFLLPVRLSSRSTEQHGTVMANSTRLRDQGAGSGALVPPGRREDADGLVVAGQTVDTGLDQDEAELAVLVLAVALKVPADSDGLIEDWISMLWRISTRRKSVARESVGDCELGCSYLLDQEVQVLGDLRSEAYS